jgi:F-type H+-transporting ATPase subunit b
MHFLLASAQNAGDWALPWCEGSSNWFCTSHPALQDLNPSHLVFMMVPFWVTVVVVSKLAIKPLLRVIEEREHRTQGARAEAADYEAKFNEKLAAYEARLAETRQKAADERGRIRATTAVEVDKILGAARADATTAVEQVRSAIDVERTKAREELKTQAESLARELATKALGRDVVGTSGGARATARTGVGS